MATTTYRPYDQYGAPYPGEHQNDSLTAVVDLLERSRMTSWITHKYRVRSRLEVHLQVVVGTSSTDGHEVVDVEVIPSADRWRDQASQLLDRSTVPSCYQPRPEGLGLQNTHDGVCHQHQH